MREEWRGVGQGERSGGEWVRVRGVEGSGSG